MAKQKAKSGQYAISGFPYGLNTSVDESLLSEKYSPRMLNVYVSENDAIVRRRGYAPLIATPVLDGGADIKSIHKFYREDGYQYLITVSGTGMYSSQLGTDNYAERDKQFLTTNVTATSKAAVESTKFVNSNAVRITGGVVCSATIPAATSLFVRIPSMSASVRVGTSGAWASVTGTSIWRPTLSPAYTEKTIQFKQSGVRDTKCARVSPTALGSAMGIFSDAVPHGTSQVGFEFKFSGTSNEQLTVGFYGGALGADKDTGLRIRTGFSSLNYLVSYPGTTGYVDTGVPIPRLNGGTEVFHKVELFRNPYFPDKVIMTLDGVSVGTATGSVGSGDTVVFAQTNAALLLVDTYELDYVLSYEFDGYTGWTKFNTGAGTMTTDASSGSTSKRSLVIDEAKFSYTFTSTKVAKVSATAENFAFVTMNNRVFFSNEYDSLRHFNGVSASTVTAPPTSASNPNGTGAGGFMVENKRRIFQAGAHVDQTLMQFSSVDDGDDWTVAHDAGVARVVAPNSDAVCTGITQLQKNVFYFSYSRAVLLNTTGPATGWGAQDISTTHGCIAPRSLCTGDNGIVFLSADGVRGYGPLQSIFANDGSGFSMLSKNVSGLNRTLTTPVPDGATIDNSISGYTDAQRKAAIGAVYDNRYWLFISTDCYVADLLKKTDNSQPVWTKYVFAGLDTYDTRVTAALVLRGDENGLLVGNAAGYVYRLDYGKSDGENTVPWYYDTPSIAVDGYTNLKHFKTAYVGCGLALPYRVAASVANLFTQDFTFRVLTDEVPRSFTPLSQYTATLSTDVRPLRIPVSSSGRAIKFMLSGTSNGEPLSIPYIIQNYGRPRLR